MKKLLILLLVFGLLIAGSSCGGGTGTSEDGKNKDDQKIEQNNNDSNDNSSIDFEEANDALDALDALIPDGWDENDYGAYIYDVYDSEFLPECFPEQIEGTLAYNTTYKDYDHDVLNGDYSVGYVNYEAKEDYREYGVSFYATLEQFEAFLSQLEQMGMRGDMDDIEEDYWSEGFYAGNGWAMYIQFNPNDDHDGEYDGCVSVSATDNLYELPESIDGIPLPKIGVVTDDYSYYTIQDFSVGYEDVDFDLERDSLPDEYYAAWFDYYGISKQDAEGYVELLKENSWSLEYEYSNEEDDYCMVLVKDNVYAIVDYEDAYMSVGFSDMIENLTY